MADTTSDQLAINELKHTWAYKRDECDLDGLMELYAPDARTELGALGDIVGIDAIRANTAARLAAFTPGSTMHQLSNGVVNVYGDTATAEWYLRVTTIDAEAGTQRTTSLGRYRDDLRRIDGEWRFSVVRLTTLWRYAG